MARRARPVPGALHEQKKHCDQQYGHPHYHQPVGREKSTGYLIDLGKQGRHTALLLSEQEQCNVLEQKRRAHGKQHRILFPLGDT